MSLDDNTKMENQKTIWTVGHSNKSIDEFLELLYTAEIQLLVDVRRFASSKAFPQFNQSELQASLAEHQIEYSHIESLGGRRKAHIDSDNMVWKHPSFRGYADYMETEVFKSAFQELGVVASQKRTVIMCAEVLWWRCHRSMISDVLKSEGWEVLHIMSETKIVEHPYTKPAQIINDKLEYPNP